MIKKSSYSFFDITYEISGQEIPVCHFSLKKDSRKEIAIGKHKVTFEHGKDGRIYFFDENGEKYSVYREFPFRNPLNKGFVKVTVRSEKLGFLPGPVNPELLQDISYGAMGFFAIIIVCLATGVIGGRGAGQENDVAPKGVANRHLKETPDTESLSYDKDLQVEIARRKKAEEIAEKKRIAYLRVKIKSELQREELSRLKKEKKKLRQMEAARKKEKNEALKKHLEAQKRVAELSVVKSKFQKKQAELLRVKNENRRKTAELEKIKRETRKKKEREKASEIAMKRPGRSSELALLSPLRGTTREGARAMDSKEKSDWANSNAVAVGSRSSIVRNPSTTDSGVVRKTFVPKRTNTRKRLNSGPVEGSFAQEDLVMNSRGRLSRRELGPRPKRKPSSRSVGLSRRKQEKLVKERASQAAKGVFRF